MDLVSLKDVAKRIGWDIYKQSCWKNLKCKNSKLSLFLFFKQDFRYQLISVWAIVENRKLVYQRKLTSKLFMKQEIEKILDDHQPNWRATMRLWEEEYRYALESNVSKKGAMDALSLQKLKYPFLGPAQKRLTFIKEIDVFFLSSPTNKRRTGCHLWFVCKSAWESVGNLAANTWWPLAIIWKPWLRGWTRGNAWKGLYKKKA